MIYTPHQSPLLELVDLENLYQTLTELYSSDFYAAQSRNLGLSISGHRGNGFEFKDIRPYQAGDDVRHIDWKASARNNKTMTKTYFEERQHQICVILDKKPPMFFATKNELKVTSAARLAAIFSFSAEINQSMFSAVILSAQSKFYPETTNLSEIFKFLHDAISSQKPVYQNDALPISEAMDLYSDSIEQSTSLYLISDFHETSLEEIKKWKSIAGQNAIYALRVEDPGEYDLGDSGTMRIQHPGNKASYLIDSSNQSLRDDYKKARAYSSKIFHNHCMDNGIFDIQISNQLDSMHQIRHIL